MAIDKILKVELIEGEIRISIGLEALAFAVEYGPDWDNQYKVDRSDGLVEFGKSIFQYLQHEEEDGTNPIHRMFDSVADEALNQGCEGFIDNDEYNEDE